MVTMKHRSRARFVAIGASAVACIAVSAFFCYPRANGAPHGIATALHRLKVMANEPDPKEYGMRALPPNQPVPPQKIVDAFGQYTGSDWPGKLHDASEFAQRRSAEQAAIAAQPGPPDRDAYGGWTKGPKLAASGYFRTAKVNGKWWLVTPTGHLFFSTGVVEVTDGINAATFTTAREYMFTTLPEPAEDRAKHYMTAKAFRGPVPEGTAYNFYQANLDRKYGPGYQKIWQDTTFKRFKSWGFNTLGSWADLDLCRLDRMPYVLTIGITGDFNHLSTGADTWGAMYDTFDPKFPKAVAKRLAMVVARGKKDPWCIGYFVDNELAWAGYGPKANYGLALGAFAQDAATSPAKRALVAQLQTKYGTIDKLNAAWESRLQSWDQLKLPHTASGDPNDARKADFTAFVRSLAHRYYSIVNSELKKQDSHHLYLGSRFNTFTPEVVQEAAKYCDVVGFNIYKTRIDKTEWALLNGLNKPCLIGEFQFGATDRGFFTGKLVDAVNQAGRASMYKDYARSVMDNPNFVGYHWFQYIDEPVVGRTFDGENYNCGLVDVTDTPYPELTAAVQQANREVYTRRYNGVK